MPKNKNAMTRYKILDELLSDRYHDYTLDDLTNIVNDRLKEGMAHLSMLNDFAQKYVSKPLTLQQPKVITKINLDPKDTCRFNKKQ